MEDTISKSKKIATVVQFRQLLDNEQSDKFTDFLAWLKKDRKKKGYTH